MRPVHFTLDVDDAPIVCSLSHPSELAWVGNVLVSLNNEHAPVALGAVRAGQHDDRWVGTVLAEPQRLVYETASGQVWVPIPALLAENIVRRSKVFQIFTSYEDARAVIGKRGISEHMRSLLKVDNIKLEPRDRPWSL